MIPRHSMLVVACLFISACADTSPSTGAHPVSAATVSSSPATNGAGTFRQIVADGIWTFAFGADLDTAIPGPRGIGGPGQPNRVRKMDVHTGAISVVSTSPSAQSTILGVSAATPVVSVETATTYRVVMGGTTIFSAGPSDGNPTGSHRRRRPTIWFSSLSGAVWRWDGSGSATQVATVPFKGVQVAGGCR